MTTASRTVLKPEKVISIVSDVILAAFPILILYRVQISFRLKIALCGLMGLGIMYVSLISLGPLRPCFYLLTEISHSTAGCCTTRAVLNWQNGSDDVTCIFKVLLTPFFSILTIATRGQRADIPMESVRRKSTSPNNHPY